MTNTKKNHVMSKWGSRKKTSALSNIDWGRSARVAGVSVGLGTLFGLTYGAHKSYKKEFQNILLDLANNISDNPNNPNNDFYLAKLIAVKESALDQMMLNKATKTRIDDVITTKLGKKHIRVWKAAHTAEMKTSFEMVLELLKADKEKRES